MTTGYGDSGGPLVCRHPDTGKWRNHDNLMNPRYWAKICVNDGNIYIAGGFTLDDEGDPVRLYSNDWEVLNLQENHPEWRLWPLTNPDNIGSSSMVNCGGQIYILDYHKFYLYDSKQDEHKEIVSDELLTHSRGLAAVDNLVFLIGGGGLRRNMVKCYNTETGVLTRVADTNHENNIFEAVGHKGAVYVLEQFGGPMEVYDVERNLWTVAEEKTNHQIISNVFLINRRDILKYISNSDQTTDVDEKGDDDNEICMVVILYDN